MKSADDSGSRFSMLVWKLLSLDDGCPTSSSALKPRLSVRHKLYYNSLPKWCNVYGIITIGESLFAHQDTKLRNEIAIKM